MQKKEIMIKFSGFILIILALFFNPFLFRYISISYVGWEFRTLFYALIIFGEFFLIFSGFIMIKNPNKIKKLLPSILLLLITIILCIFIMGVVLSLIKPKIINRKYSSDFHHMYQPNSSGYRYPDANDEFDKILITTNELGMRGPSIPLEKKEKRVLVLGDSFIHADEIPYKKTVGQVLQSKFNKKDYLIMQQGYSSWSPIVELNFLIKTYDKLKPDKVFLFLTTNDFYDNHFSASDIMYSKHTIFDEKGFPLKFNMSSGSENIKLKISQNNLVRSIINLIKKPFECKKNITQQNINYLINLNNYTKESALKVLGSDTYLSLENMIRLSRPYEKWDKENERIVNLALKNVNKINKFLKKRNASLTLLLIPMGWNVYPDETIIGKKSRFYCFDEDLILPDTGITSKLKDFAFENKIDYIPLRDLMISFREENPNKKLYLQSDGHLNEEGHNLLGEILYHYLIEKI